MTKREQKEFVEQCKGNANKPKDYLLMIMDNLRQVGADREADALEKVIIRLEVWQNK